MSADTRTSFDPFDPFGVFKPMRDAWLDAAASSMVEWVNTESYAEATGAMLENWMNVAVPLREAQEKFMTQFLQQLAMPSRQEVTVLAGRLTQVETRLDDLDIRLDEVNEKLDRIEACLGAVLEDLTQSSSGKPLKPVPCRKPSSTEEQQGDNEDGAVA